MSSLEINPPNHLRISQTHRSHGAVDLPEPGLRARTRCRLERPQRQPGVVGSQRQAADRVPVEPERAARAAGAVRRRGRLQRATGFVQQLALDRRQPGAARARQHQQPPALSRPRSSPAPATSITLSNVTRIQKDGWIRYRALQTKVEKRYAHGRVAARLLRVVADARRSKAATRTPTTIDAEVGPRRRPIARTTSSPAASTSCRSAATARSAATGAAGPTPLLGGWSVSPIVTLTSGAPLNLTVNGNPSNTERHRPPERRRRLAARRTRPPSAGSTPTAFVANAPLHLRQRAAEPAARARLRQPRHRAAQVVPAVRRASPPTCASSRSTPPTASTSATPTRRSATRASAASRRPARRATTRSPCRLPVLTDAMTRDDCHDSPPASPPASSPSRRSAPAALAAHHAFAAEFDANKPITLDGTLTKVAWVNPHGWIYVDVNGQGRQGHQLGDRVRQPQRAAAPRAAQGRLPAGHRGDGEGLPGQERQAGRQRVDGDAARRPQPVRRIVDDAGRPAVSALRPWLLLAALAVVLVGVAARRSRPDASGPAAAAPGRRSRAPPTAGPTSPASGRR